MKHDRSRGRVKPLRIVMAGAALIVVAAIIVAAAAMTRERPTRRRLALCRTRREPI